ncbi:DUF6232 family protein [uncultured Oscillibacter sp.]|uniref:DUF6232 family protein n=1 Tax=uncultured Oscillibacter sp. TaxID=876091 RepID=UPI002613DFD8|nr:DUF6232 family protein [uncultured Oscillibacter sp.]
MACVTEMRCPNGWVEYYTYGKMGRIFAVNDIHPSEKPDNGTRASLSQYPLHGKSHLYKNTKNLLIPERKERKSIMKTDLNTSKNIDTPFLRIRGNCLEIKNTTIQLSNISLFSTADIAPAKFPIFSIVLILVGLLLLGKSVVPALIAIAFGGGWIFYWYSSVQKTKEMKRLTIVTNSGNVFPIVFDDQAFLSRVVTIMTDIIRDPERARNITINVKECTFSDDATVVGNMYQS